MINQLLEELIEIGKHYVRNSCSNLTISKYVTESNLVLLCVLTTDVYVRVS